jgi:superfamily II DNA or RNA helicase
MDRRWLKRFIVLLGFVGAMPLSTFTWAADKVTSYVGCESRLFLPMAPSEKIGKFPLGEYRRLIEGDRSSRKNLRIETVGDDLADPVIEVSDRERVLNIPRRYLARAPHQEIQNWIKRLLVGSKLHPYNVSTDESLGDRVGDQFILRSAQTEGIKAAIEAQRRGQKKFLYVAPTATGKTQVIVEVLDYRLQHSSKKLHIVTADQVHLIKQLTHSLELGLKTPAQIITWGGDNSSQRLGDLIENVRASSAPVVLVTTIQSLKNRFREEYGDFDQVDGRGLRSLFSVLGTLAYDETHHMGAEEAQELTTLLMAYPSSEVFLFGTTATPLHHDVAITDLYDNRGFWAYLDTAETYFDRDAMIERPLSSILDQLAAAIDSGDLTPFDEFHILIPEKMLAGQMGEIFITSREDANEGVGFLQRVDKKAFPEIEQELLPLFKKHKRGFISVATIKEADELAEFLNKSENIKSRKFAAFHSDLSRSGQNEIENDFREGRIDYLVTIRKLDEGMDYPDLSLYIDLNRSVGIRQLVQRLGRILRLHENKEMVDIAVMTDMTDTDMRETLMLMEGMLERRFSGGVHNVGPYREQEHINLSELGRIITEIKKFWEKRQFMNKEEFLAWVKENNIRSGLDFQKRFGAGGDRPANVPSDPRNFYDMSWSEITGNLPWKEKSLAFMDRVEFMAWVKANKITSSKDFDRRFGAGGDRPASVPANPRGFYDMSWSEITGNLPSRDKSRRFMDKENFLAWVKANEITSISDFKRRFGAGGDRPADVPAHPRRFYGMSWSEITGGPTRRDRSTFMSKERFLVWAKANKITSVRVFKEGDWPADVPSDPQKFYDMSWTEITGNLGRRDASHFMSKENFLAWAKANKINSGRDFFRRFGRLRSGRPASVPFYPQSFYNITWPEITGKKGFSTGKVKK